MISAEGENAFSKVKYIGNTFTSKSEISFSTVSDYSTIVNSIEKSLSELENSSVLLTSTDDLRFSFYSTGNFAVYLDRQGKIIDLASVSRTRTLVSGEINAGDRVMIINHSANDDNNHISQKGVKQLIEVSNDFLSSQIDRQVKQGNFVYPISVVRFADQEDLSESSMPNRNAIVPFLPIGQIIMNLAHISNSLRYKRSIADKKKLIALGVVLLAIGFLSTRMLSHPSQKDPSSTTISFVQQKLNDAVKTDGQNSEAAQLDLFQAKQSISELQKTNPKDPQVKRLSQTLLQINQQVFHIHQVNSLPTVLDLSLIKKGFSASRLVLQGENVLLLSDADKTLTMFSLTDHSNQLLAGMEKLGNASFSDMTSQKVYVYTPGKGVIQIDPQSLKATVVITPDSEWSEISDIRTFGSNVYLLDAIRNQIYKYVPNSSVLGFNPKVLYLQEDQTTQFATPKKMLIDGSIWILTEGGSLVKLTGGVIDSYTLDSLDPSLSTISNFYLSSDSDNLYILDSTNSRLIVFTKKGQYLKQYQGSIFKDTKDFVVDEKSKTMYILEGNKIYKLDIS